MPMDNGKQKDESPYHDHFPGGIADDVALVGGKAGALIRMADAGLPVPLGMVLTSAFFAPWFNELKASAIWSELVVASVDRWPDLCGRLKTACETFALTAKQRQTLVAVRARLARLAPASLFAVRSSSPDEDLTTASFAGGYETSLGVCLTDLEAALRRCFVSSIDVRVLVYKRERGFDPFSPSIAVVVQQQIDSEVAGVCFSLNPITNDYDEAVIEANWGLGESVVAGRVSPDRFVVDKLTYCVIDRHLGTKQRSTWLVPEGGTAERSQHRSDVWTLDDAKLRALTILVSRIEVMYERPMDIEWAYDRQGELNVLQARPITAYVPLPPEMLTAAGERRRLYADAALSKGMTINAPISPMGLDLMAEMFVEMVASYIAPMKVNTTPRDSFLFFCAGGRMYSNLSNLMRLVGMRRMSKANALNDALLAETLANIDETRYRALSAPRWFRLRALFLALKVLWRARGFVWQTIRAITAPARARRRSDLQIQALERNILHAADYTLPFDAFRRRLAELLRRSFNMTMAPLTSSLFALSLVDRVVGRKSPEKLAMGQKLKLGFIDNVVVDMGVALFRLARLLDGNDTNDVGVMQQRLASRQLSTEFLNAWDTFIKTYGRRGPLEMDIANPRYADDAALALRQISYMPIADPAFDTQALHRRQVSERRQAYRQLLRSMGWFRRILLRRIHTIIELFAGMRDTPKHVMLLMHQAVRKRALMDGMRFVRQGRLRDAKDIFNLTFEDLRSAEKDVNLDLNTRCEERTRFLKVLKIQVTNFPSIVDSRGRILRPAPRFEKAGELRGMAVSPGIVAGPVKCLRTPFEKPICKGDILVAYTTDPGWTPLFASAAAVVLEIGGILQHGAVVAREYGKPCVVGIDGVMTKLRDGQQVVVDGSNGIVRIV